MLDSFHIVRLSAEQVRERAEQLSEVLSDCVTGGASVSFMPPFGPGDAKPFWLATAESCEAGQRIVLAAIMDSMAVGSVQLLPVGIPNQPHRAEIAKLLVHRKARRRGIGRTLMLAAEAEARRLGRSLLTFDTTTGDSAEKLYWSLNFVRAGVIPGYALKPDGSLIDTSVFYKLLESGGAGQKTGFPAEDCALARQPPVITAKTT
jgi:ribosomal protein S18 acetylase RimI-like enzyme